MSEETTPKAKAAPKKAAAPKAASAAPKAAAEKTVALKPAAKKTAPTAKAERTTGIKVTQTGSGFGRGAKQIATLKGLGLNKMHRSRILEDTPSVRGMVNKISHLLKIEQIG